MESVARRTEGVGCWQFECLQPPASAGPADVQCRITFLILPLLILGLDSAAVALPPVTSPTLRSPRPPFLPPLRPPLRRDRVPPPAVAGMPPPPPLPPSSPLPAPPAACPKRSRSSLVVTRSRPSPALCPCCRRAWRARCSARRSRAHCLRTVPHRRTASLALRAPTSSMPPPAASVATASVPRLTSPASSHSCRSLSSACQSWNVCSGS